MREKSSPPKFPPFPFRNKDYQKLCLFVCLLLEGVQKFFVVVFFSPPRQGYVKAAASYLPRGQLPPLTGDAVPYPGTIRVINTYFY